VRAVAAETDARPFGYYLILAFPILAAAAMITLLFTVGGPVLWGLSSAAVIALVVGVLLGLPENRRYDHLRKNGVWAPAVWIAVAIGQKIRLGSN
jgi:membrane protein YdbS with pleckstrin-like domain